MSRDRAILRHILATIRYRGTKVTVDAPDGFDMFDVGGGTRRPVEVVAHIGDLFDWTATIIAGEEQWSIATPLPWYEELERFHAGLDRLDAMLASDMPIAAPTERLIQGPLADALTHIGQLALMRRMAGASIRGENFFAAEIAATNR